MPAIRTASSTSDAVKIQRSRTPAKSLTDVEAQPAPEPPAWFMEVINRLETKIDELERRIDQNHHETAQKIDETKREMGETKRKTDENHLSMMSEIGVTSRLSALAYNRGQDTEQFVLVPNIKGELPPEELPRLWSLDVLRGLSDLHASEYYNFYAPEGHTGVETRAQKLDYIRAAIGCVALVWFDDDDDD